MTILVGLWVAVGVDDQGGNEAADDADVVEVGAEGDSDGQGRGLDLLELLGSVAGAMARL
jgi:hypothetical protein